jgi:hypothetical protein
MEEGDTCPDRARLASCPEAMDCSDPRHHEAASPGGKHLGVSVELTTDDLRDIDTAASKITVQGARYPEKLEKTDRPERLGFLIRKLIKNFAIESDRQFVAKSTSPVYLVRRNRLQLYDSVSDTR